jgi:transcriptional regulator NrdR family protein
MEILQMICPKCKGRAEKVGMIAFPESLLRRFECVVCKHRYTTIEQYKDKVVFERNSDVESAALEIVALELGRAKAKHPEFPQWNSDRLCIINEELGELAAAINDGECKDRQIEEAAHVAVTAIRFIEERLK